MKVLADALIDNSNSDRRKQETHYEMHHTNKDDSVIFGDHLTAMKKISYDDT